MYTLTTAKLLYMQRWNDYEIPTTEEWLVKKIEFAEMEKLTCLIREKSVTTLVTRNHLWTFC